jgi:hypothetical protein
MIKQILEWLDRKIEERARYRESSIAEWKRVNGICDHDWGIWHNAEPNRFQYRHCCKCGLMQLYDAAIGEIL